MKLYKLTDVNGQTYRGTQWGEGVTHVAPGKGKTGLCTDSWIHAYRTPRMAVFMNPAHARFGSPRLWEAEAYEVGIDDGTKVGCLRLTTVREIPLPTMTTEQRVEIAIRAVMSVYDEPLWTQWTAAWLDGTDRTRESAAAYAATDAATYATNAAASAAAYATNAAANAAYAAYAAANVADATNATLNLGALMDEVCDR